MSATKKRIVAAAKEADAKEEKDLVSEADGKVEDELDEKEEKKPQFERRPHTTRTNRKFYTRQRY